MGPIVRRRTRAAYHTEILGRVLETEPDWTRLPAQTPEGIRNLLGRCLRKERRSRLHDIADARIEIEDVQSGTPHKGRDAVVSSTRFVRGPWLPALARRDIKTIAKPAEPTIAQPVRAWGIG
jgi:hypothetical protein